MHVEIGHTHIKSSNNLSWLRYPQLMNGIIHFVKNQQKECF